MAAQIPNSNGSAGPAQLTALAILPDRALALAFLQALSASRAFQISAEWTSYPPASKLMTQLRQARPDVVLIDVSSDLAQGSALIDAAFSSPTPVPVIALHSAFISLTASGFTVIAWSYDDAVAPPALQKIVSAADDATPVAPGGLVTVWGRQLSPVNIASSELPLPTALADSCLTVNGALAPMLFASPGQINAQLPFEVQGNATLVLHTPGGTSNNLNFTILPTAPSVFRSGVAGPQSGIPTVIRAKNNKLVTTANPVHRGEAIVIWATGLGRTNPPLATGMAAPAHPLPAAAVQPEVSLGGLRLPLYYAGLAPGQVGVYQINALVPGWAPTGMQVPLVITQGSAVTAVTVRVID